MKQIIISKNLNEFILWKKLKIVFVNVETDPRPSSNMIETWYPSRYLWVHLVWIRWEYASSFKWLLPAQNPKNLETSFAD
jgi:hypothetical protein